MPTTFNGTIYHSTTETAKLIRTAIKNTFPGHKVSVRSESYSMGCSIHITIPSDTKLTDEQIEELRQLVEHYQGSKFDGSRDLKETVYTRNEDGTLCHYMADFIFVHRS